MRSRYVPPRFSHRSQACKCLSPAAFKTNPHRFPLLLWLASSRNPGCAGQWCFPPCTMFLHFPGGHRKVLQHARYVCEPVLGDERPHWQLPEISNPRLVVLVGSLGLASNIVGLFLFHGAFPACPRRVCSIFILQSFRS